MVRGRLVRKVGYIMMLPNEIARPRASPLRGWLTVKSWEESTLEEALSLQQSGRQRHGHLWSLQLSPEPQAELFQ